MITPNMAPALTQSALSWSTAVTLADLGMLTADWLEGRLDGEHPNGYDRPANETLPMIPSLAAANRAGIVTLDSQAGGDDVVDGESWEKSAMVLALVDDRTMLQELTWQAWARGLQVVVHRTHAREDGWQIPVTFRNGEVTADAGLRLPEDELAVQWETCNPQALEAVMSAWQVTVLDPELNRTGVLCAALDAVTGRGEPGSAPTRAGLLAGMWDGVMASVAVTVTAVDSRATAFGSPWAVVTLEDDSGSVECLVFPATYLVVAESLTVGARLMVRGRVDRRESPVRLVAHTVTAAPE